MSRAEDIRALLDQGLTHYGLGEVQRALESWNRVLALEPSNPRAIEYIRFVEENWAPAKDQPDETYRPDEGSDPKRGAGAVGTAAEPEPAAQTARAESGFVPPSKPIAQSGFWGDLYTFDPEAGGPPPEPPPEASSAVDWNVPGSDADAAWDSQAWSEPGSASVQPEPGETPAQDSAKADLIHSSTLPPRPASQPAGSAADPEPDDLVQPALRQEAAEPVSGIFELPPPHIQEQPRAEPQLVIAPKPPFGVLTDTPLWDLAAEPKGPLDQGVSALGLVSGAGQGTAAGAAGPGAGDSIEALMRGVRDMLELDDFSGAIELLDKVLEQEPGQAEAGRLLEEASEELLKIFNSKIGSLGQVPEVRMAGDEVIWLNLDHRAGFLLSLVDGQTSYEDILSVCGLSQLEGMRILVQLLQEKVIVPS